jgi:hypothetical protein
MVSPTGYINSDLAIDWLHHFIRHAGITPGSPEHILLMDSHQSHVSNDFKIICLEYNITPWAFPSHMTHIMQPLDVSCFQPYKHWHDKANKKALRAGELSYGISDFLYDLPSIRDQTFKPGTIKKGFLESGLWPLSEKKVLMQMKV